ncbi:hypothetical protein [Dyadobacter koreensis]|uniref:hypothetical protein n=1 Tax=Dyadobacter koreensis TaxID=408657 RepID=UPI000B88DFF7|nr:hypothetical protein [Dyadobacter koreensis]
MSRQADISFCCSGGYDQLPLGFFDLLLLKPNSPLKKLEFGKVFLRIGFYTTRLVSIARWLPSYQYRLEISWWVFITVLNVSYQTIRVAPPDPVQFLKPE